VGGEHNIINPPELGTASGYSNGILTEGGKLLFIAGQIAWDTEHRLIGPGDFVAQFEQALRNVLAVVSAAGGRPEHLTELTIFITDKRSYFENAEEIGRRYRALCGKHFPAMALVVVKDLLEEGALVEIRGTAVLPQGA
jgi:enamine deaminase RidA (YjgF/YER057c/UK114 family)